MVNWLRGCANGIDRFPSLFLFIVLLYDFGLLDWSGWDYLQRIYICLSGSELTFKHCCLAKENNMPKFNSHFPRGLKITTRLRAEPCCLCGSGCLAAHSSGVVLDLPAGPEDPEPGTSCWGKPGAEEPRGVCRSSPRCELSQFCSFIWMILQLKILFFFFFLMLCSVPTSANEVLWNCPDQCILQSSPLSFHKRKKGCPDLRASWCALRAMLKKVPVCFVPGVWAARVILFVCFGNGLFWWAAAWVFPIVDIHRSSSWMAPVSCFPQRRLSASRSKNLVCLSGGGMVSYWCFCSPVCGINFFGWEQRGCKAAGCYLSISLQCLRATPVCCVGMVCWYSPITEVNTAYVRSMWIFWGCFWLLS